MIVWAGSPLFGVMIAVRMTFLEKSRTEVKIERRGGQGFDSARGN